MDSIKHFVNSHKWLVTIFSIIFVGLPQYVDSLWDLAEKIQGRSITMHNIAWAYWITVPLGLVMFAVAIWAIRTGTPAKDRSRSLSNIPKVIHKMHERLTLLVARMPALTKTEIDTFGKDYLELLGLDERRYPELKQITPISDAKADREIMGIVVDRLLSTFTELDVVKSLLIRTGGLMNIKGAGISKVRDNDGQYARLERKLARLRPEIPPELNTAIDNYQQFSFGFISLYRLTSSIPYGEVANIMPANLNGEMGIQKERIETAMNELLAEVTSLIQEPTHETFSPP